MGRATKTVVGSSEAQEIRRSRHSPLVIRPTPSTTLQQLCSARNPIPPPTTRTSLRCDSFLPQNRRYLVLDWHGLEIVPVCFGAMTIVAAAAPDDRDPSVIECGEHPSGIRTRLNERSGGAVGGGTMTAVGGFRSYSSNSSPSL